MLKPECLPTLPRELRTHLPEDGANLGYSDEVLDGCHSCLQLLCTWCYELQGALLALHKLHAQPLSTKLPQPLATHCVLAVCCAAGVRKRQAARQA